MLNGMTGSTGISSSGCGEMSAKKYLRTHSTGLNFGSSRTSVVNFSRVARKVIRCGWIFCPVRGSMSCTRPLKTTVLIMSSGVEAKISRSVRRAIWAMTL